MNISSPSFGFVNHFATSPPLATTGRLPPSVSKGADNMKDGVGEHGAGRTNRLTQALSAALRELGIGGTGSTGMKPGKTLTPATTDITAAAAASPAAPSTGGDLNGAIEQFAHALMNALGDALGAGRAARGHSGEHRQDGEHGHQGHGARHNPYGNLAQRLQDLSQTVVQPAPTALTTSAPATAAAAVNKTPISLPPVADSERSVAAPAPAAQAPVQAQVQAAVIVTAPAFGTAPSVATAPASAPAPATAPAPIPSPASPLLTAFTRLFDALKPQTPSDAPATDMAARLQQFLHTMAQALSNSGGNGTALSRTGAFINVQA